MSYDKAAEIAPSLAKPLLDGASIAAAVGSLAGYLPSIAALASLVWSLIRIYETKTVQRWIGK